MIIAFCGFAGSGKDTAADYLVDFHNFRRMSFAGPLKDTVAAIFGWDRKMLEGRTSYDRKVREQVDAWWANRLGISHLTPRWVLQNWGTDVLRNAFHQDIWIASLENKLRHDDTDIVVTDARFPNEMKSIKSVGGYIIRIKRGDDPTWIDDARIVNSGPSNLNYEKSLNNLNQLRVHYSERNWIDEPVDFIIENDGNIDQLFEKIENLISNLESNHLASMANQPQVVNADS
jgi:hypothetical protein